MLEGVLRQRRILGWGVRTRGDRAPGSVDASLSMPVCRGEGICVQA